MTHNCSSQLAAGEEETKFSAPLVAAQTSTVYTGLLVVPTRWQQLIFHADSMSPEMSRHIHLTPYLPKLALEQRPQGHVPSWRLDGTDPYGRPLAASLRKTGRGRSSRPLAEPARHESRQNSSSDHFWRTWSWPASTGMGDAFVLTAWTFSHLPIRVQCDEEIEYNTLSFHDNKHTNVASKILLRKKCLFDLCRPTLHKTTERTTKM